MVFGAQQEWIARAEDEYKKALILDDDCSEALCSRAIINERSNKLYETLEGLYSCVFLVAQRMLCHMILDNKNKDFRKLAYLRPEFPFAVENLQRWEGIHTDKEEELRQIRAHPGAPYVILWNPISGGFDLHFGDTQPSV